MAIARKARHFPQWGKCCALSPIGESCIGESANWGKCLALSPIGESDEKGVSPLGKVAGRAILSFSRVKGRLACSFIVDATRDCDNVIFNHDSGSSSSHEPNNKGAKGSVLRLSHPSNVIQPRI